MRQLLPRFASLGLVAVLWVAATLASLPSQTKTIDVLSTKNQNCIDMSVRRARLGPHLYSIKLNAPDRCTGCRIQEVSARVLFDVNYCQYTVRSVRGRSGQSIRVIESLRTVELKGPDPSALRRQFAIMCNQGGVPLPINTPIKLEQEVDGIEIEFENGRPVRIEAPLPMSAWVGARDSCENDGVAIVPISPGD